MNDQTFKQLIRGKFSDYAFNNIEDALTPENLKKSNAFAEDIIDFLKRCKTYEATKKAL